MTGNEVYKEFDSTSIVTNTTSSGTVTFKNYTLRTRELILGLVAFIALLGFFVLAIVLAVELGKKDGNDATSATQASAQTGSDGNTCVTPSCLKAALFHKSALNEFADPCKDFYAYACGGYAAANPQTLDLADVTPVNQIVSENSLKLVNMLVHAVQRDMPHSYERKLKAFISSCTNHFDKMELRGHPFYYYVVAETPGWYLLGQWNETTFDFDELIRQVHIDFWTPAFFNVFINVDDRDYNKNVVEIDVGGMGMTPMYYGNEQAMQTYAEFVRHMAGLLVKDASPDVDPAESEARVNLFAEDVLEMESGMANIVLNFSPLHNDPHAEELRMTLGDLTKDVNNTIDFTAYMKHLFNEWPDKFNDDTKVVVLRNYFFGYLGQLLAHYFKDPLGKRKMHNYLMWQLLHRYSSELSWEYVHAGRKMNYLMTGKKSTDSGYMRCYLAVEHQMPDAINAVFLNQYLDVNKTAEGTRIVAHIKQQVLDSLDSFPWLSSADLIIAKDKIKGSIEKIGFPGYLKDDKYMDQLYAHIQINPNDYFSNVLALNAMQRKKYNNLIGYQSSRRRWTFHVFLPVVKYYNPWHELMVTAAALQNPLFSDKGPSYYNYGGIGTSIAKSFIHAIDQIGNMYRLDGSQFGSWWSNVTRTRYDQVKQCAVKAQQGKEIGPFNMPDSSELYRPNTTMTKRVYATSLLAESTGLRLSYKAYKKDRRFEKLPPGINGATPDKMFFLAYAQTKCQNSPDVVKASQIGIDIVPHDYNVNLVMAQVPEFAKAYRCPSTSPYSKDNRCLLFP